MKNLIVLGGSGIGMIAISIAKELGNYTIGGFLNDVIPVGERIGKYERSVVLPDDFECWDEGEFLGNMSKEVKPLLKTKGS